MECPVIAVAVVHSDSLAGRILFHERILWPVRLAWWHSRCEVLPLNLLTNIQNVLSIILDSSVACAGKNSHLQHPIDLFSILCFLLPVAAVCRQDIRPSLDASLQDPQKSTWRSLSLISIGGICFYQWLTQSQPTSGTGAVGVYLQQYVVQWTNPLIWTSY